MKLADIVAVIVAIVAVVDGNEVEEDSEEIAVVSPSEDCSG